MPDHHDLWALRSLPAVSAQKWDVVISTGGPYSTHLVGYILKRRGKADRWGVDWRDLWTDNHIYPGLPLVRMVERYAEHKFHQHADVITTVSEPLAAKLRLKAGNKVKVIYNGFDPEDYENLPVARIFPEDGVFRIVYTGTLYPGKDIGRTGQDISPATTGGDGRSQRRCIRYGATGRRQRVCALCWLCAPARCAAHATRCRCAALS
jgi:glycosyltransferase involved in cell wall biosynthesis